MKKILLIVAAAGFIGWLSLAGCKKETIDPGTYVPVSFSVPAGWPQPVYTFANNQLTSDGFKLGRKLFYDPRLSRDNSISCGSCHQQFAAFANLDHPLSHGVNNLLGKRNSPGLSNAAWFPTFFWDGGVINIENQPINPIENHVEMDMTMPEVLNRLSADATYVAMYKKAFGSDTINSQRTFRALAQFMAAMVSNNSKFDRVMRHEAGVSFTEQEQRGYEAFGALKCSSCHSGLLFSDFSYRNNGLAPDFAVNDSGRAHITRDPNDLYKFKMPSLRNVALTAPYMHDGRFTTLDAVLEHYRNGVVQSPTLDIVLQNGIVMSDAQKADIISFLKTLTDSTFVHDPLFAEPVN